MLLFSKILALISLLFFFGGILYHYFVTKRLKFPSDFARPKGSWKVGVLYSFTLGMMPWAKESTRRHWIAYLRGVAFHIGIFSGLFILVLSFFSEHFNETGNLIFALIIGFGALMGFVGIVMRIFERNLREISTFDDFISVVLVSISLAFIALALIEPVFKMPMYFTSAIMLFYAPLGKIRHCLYFFFSRFFFGLHLGKRGIVHRFTEVSYGK
jgi:hypothetical protein